MSANTLTLDSKGVSGVEVNFFIFNSRTGDIQLFADKGPVKLTPTGAGDALIDTGGTINIRTAARLIGGGITLQGVGANWAYINGSSTNSVNVHTNGDLSILGGTTVGGLTETAFISQVSSGNISINYRDLTLTSSLDWLAAILPTSWWADITARHITMNHLTGGGAKTLTTSIGADGISTGLINIRTINRGHVLIQGSSDTTLRSSEIVTSGKIKMVVEGNMSFFGRQSFFNGCANQKHSW